MKRGFVRPMGIDAPMRIRARLAAVALLALAGVLTAKDARADVRLYDGNDLTFDAALTVGVGFFSSPNANFGAGTYHTGGGQRIAGSPVWFEGFTTPELKLSYYRPNLGQFYGDVSAIGAMTRGDGDANLIPVTSGNPTSIAVENAYVGWRSGRLFGDLNDDALDISAGRQSFQIGDGFLIGDGTADTGRRGAYIMGPRTAFSGIGIVRVNTEPVRGDVFALTSTTDQTLARNLDQPQMGFVGANIEWFETKSNEDGRFSYTGRERYVGAMALHAYEGDRNGCFSIGNCPNGPSGVPSGANRDGLTVLSARAGGSLIAPVPDLSLYGEYAFETNGKAGNKVNANAWYAEPGWSFSKLPWTPRVFYRYSHFSGDPNPNDDVKRSFDPLFYTSGRDYGTWFLGEVAGQYLLFNSNDNVHQVGFTVNPTDALKLGILFYDFFFDKKAQAGVTDNHVMTEVDLTAQWAVSSKLSLTGVFGIAQPAAGGREFVRNQTAGFSNVPGNLDRVWMATELMAIYKF